MSTHYRPGQIPTATIIVASIFVVMFVGTVTFFVYQFQKGGTKAKNTNTTVVNKAKKNNNKNTNANVNTNTPVVLDLAPLATIPDTWKYYTNQVVTYSVRYPADWTLQEVNVADHPVQKIPVRYVQITNPNNQVVLTLGVRQVGGIFGIGERTTSPTGTLKTGLSLPIGGVTIVSALLQVDGKTSAVFYHPVKPFGYSYIQGHEVQAELDLVNTPGVASTITDLVATTDTQIANTIMSSLTFTGINQPLTPPEPQAAALGQYKIETYRVANSTVPDTRLINLDGGQRTVIINSTRTAAGLVSGHGLMELIFPAFGETLFLQDAALSSQSAKGAIWTYNVRTKQLTKQGTYPALGWGTLVANQVRTRAVYVSSLDPGDSGDVKTLYYLDIVKNTLSTLLVLKENETFSSGWGGITNSFSIGWRTDDLIRYVTYDQSSGNKQRNVVKTKISNGQVVAPGANPATQ